jgi:hypothetical protein
MKQLYAIALNNSKHRGFQCFLLASFLLTERQELFEICALLGF